MSTSTSIDEMGAPTSTSTSTAYTSSESKEDPDQDQDLALVPVPESPSGRGTRAGSGGGESSRQCGISLVNDLPHSHLPLVSHLTSHLPTPSLSDPPS